MFSQYEVLRLYTPVANFGRTAGSSLVMNTSSGNYHIPANTQVYLCGAQLHVDANFWGDTAFDFCPARWLSGGGEEYATPKVPSGQFIPWSMGPRVCPGMKMAQVEFLSLVFTLFRQARVKPVVKEGETAEMASDRIVKVTKDSMPLLTLQMNKPADVDLVWSERVRSD